MVNDPKYAPTLSETARRNISAVVQGIIAATGISETLVSRLGKSDGAFLKRLPENSISLRSYDEFMGRLSAAWPDDAAWPESVPRPEPTLIPDDIRADYEAALIKRRSILAAEAAREARRIAKEAKAVARHVSGRGSNNTAGGEQAPAHS